MMKFQHLALIVALWLLPSAAYAQLGTGRVSGTIRDERGRPIKGATVTAENEAYFPRSLTSATDARGRFSIFGLRRITYTITIRADGFEEVTVSLPISMTQANPPVDVHLVRKLAPGPPPLLANADAGRLQEALDAAAAMAEAGRIDAAVTAYRRILKDTPALTSINLQLGYLHERRGDRAAAISAYEAMLKADRSSLAARSALSRLQGTDR